MDTGGRRHALRAQRLCVQHQCASVPGGYRPRVGAGRHAPPGRDYRIRPQDETARHRLHLRADPRHRGGVSRELSRRAADGPDGAAGHAPLPAVAARARRRGPRSPAALSRGARRLPNGLEARRPLEQRAARARRVARGRPSTPIWLCAGGGRSGQALHHEARHHRRPSRRQGDAPGDYAGGQVCTTTSSSRRCSWWATATCRFTSIRTRT